MTTVNLPEEALRDLEKLASSKKLGSIVDAFPSLEKSRDRAAAISTIAESAAIPLREAEELFRSIAAVVDFCETFGVEPERAYELLSAGIENSTGSDWDPKNTPGWKGNKDNILKLISPDNPVAVLIKSNNIKNAHEHLWLSGSIYTDVRPTFNSNGDRVLRASVTHMLAISYREGARRREFHVALDDSDLRSLGKSLERAVKKSKAISGTLECWPLDSGIDSDES